MLERLKLFSRLDKLERRVEALERAELERRATAIGKRLDEARERRAAAQMEALLRYNGTARKEDEE